MILMMAATVVVADSRVMGVSEQRRSLGANQMSAVSKEAASLDDPPHQKAPSPRPTTMT
jgi:hypothetical protein